MYYGFFCSVSFSAGGIHEKKVKKRLDLYTVKAVYYIVRFEIVRGWVTGHTEMANDLRDF